MRGWSTRTGIFLMLVFSGSFVLTDLVPDLENNCSFLTIVTDVAKKNKQIKEHEMVQCIGFPKEILPLNVTKMEISKASLENVTATSIGRLPASLMELNLQDCNISNIESGAFNQFHQLIELSIKHNHIQRLVPRIFTLNGKLKELHMPFNEIEVIEDGAFFNLLSLKILLLEGNHLKHIPKKLPPNLQELYLMDNKIEKLEDELSKLNLEVLDLCGNPLKEFPTDNNIKFKTITHLCLTISGKTELPPDFAQKVPLLENLTLKANGNFEMNVNSLIQLNVLKNLNTLRLVNYNISSLNFLADLPELKNLDLHNVLLTKPVDSNLDLSGNKLTSLHLDDSKELVASLIPNRVLKKLKNLIDVSLKNTNLKKLHLDDFPQTIAISIKDNPLNCDCDLKWIVLIKLQGQKHHMILDSDAKCEYPNEANNKEIVEYLENLDCSTKSEEKLEESTENPIPFYTHYPHMDLNNDDENISLAIIIIISVIVFLIIVVFVVAIIFYILMKKRQKKMMLSTKEPTLKELQQASSEDKLLTKE